MDYRAVVIDEKATTAFVKRAGVRVLKLVRVKIGAVAIGTLQIGKWRPLTAREVAGFRGA